MSKPSKSCLKTRSTIVNPETGRQILVGGPTYKQLQKKYDAINSTRLRRQKQLTLQPTKIKKVRFKRAIDRFTY